MSLKVKTKTHISYAVTAQLICIFVLALAKSVFHMIWPNYGLILTTGLRFSIKNQRTNGPVNAHLRPEIYTCTNKLVRLEWYNACI